MLRHKTMALQIDQFLLVLLLERFILLRQPRILLLMHFDQLQLALHLSRLQRKRLLTQFQLPPGRLINNPTNLVKTSKKVIFRDFQQLRV